jgi:hypothetical protein
LSSSYPYTGPEAVHIVNDKGLSIAHKGSATLPTSFSSLKLTNVLHLPEITKNLLSVSQLTLDNNVRIEFSLNFYFIKDKETNQTLLHGILHRGLYQLIPVSSH